MTSRETKAKFESLLSGHKNPNHPDAIISCMLDFYRNERAEDCRIEDDGDILLYQWGTFDWGNGPWFDLNITRQFIPSGEEDDEIFQLSVSAKYLPTLELDALGSGSQWCESPDELRQFHEFINKSPALTQLSGKDCSAIEITYNQAG